MAANSRRLYIDLSRQEYWHRKEWEMRLASWKQAEVILSDRPNDADWILRTDAPQLGDLPSVSVGSISNREFVWDAGDHPSGRRCGLYASLPRSQFSPTLHRTFSYPLIYNECIEPFDSTDARFLLGFVGGITSGLRARLLQVLAQEKNSELFIDVTGGPWNGMFDRSGLAVKLAYAEALRRSRFFLCPRGNGVSSVRLFETMQAARVPVIVSDAYVLPLNIDWNKCAIFIKEREINRLVDLVEARRSDWEKLASNARRAWEANFGNERILATIGGHLGALAESRTALSVFADTRQSFRIHRAEFRWRLRKLFFELRQKLRTA